MASSQNNEIAAAQTPGVWVWDHDRRRIVWANESALRFWGERTVLDLLDRDFPPSDPATEQFAQLLSAATAADTERVRTRLTLTPGGQPRRVNAIAARFTLADGRAGLRISAQPLPVGLASEPERMREIFATAPQAMALFAEDGTLLVQNDAAELIFGSGRLAGLVARYGTRKTARDALRALLVSGSFSHSAILNTRAGARRHRVTMRRIHDPVTGAFAALTSFADTAERDNMPALTTSSGQESSQALLDTINVAIAIYDDALKPLYMSDRARHLTGLGDNVPIPNLAVQFPQDHDRITAALLAMRDGHTDAATLDLTARIQGDTMRRIEMRMKKGVWQGASAWVATIADAAPLGPDGRSAALGAIGVGVVSLHMDGTVTAIDATAADLLGRKRDDHRPLAKTLDPVAASDLSDAMAQYKPGDSFKITPLDARKPLLIGIAAGNRPDERTLTLRALEYDTSAKPGIFERREAVARASHELRTPLNAIIGFTQLMLEDPSPIRSTAYVDYLQDINDSGAYMLRLLQDLLDMRRIEADTLKLESSPIDLGNLLRVIVREIDFAARKRDVDITLSVEPDLPPVLADPHTMRQALTNIISNAVKFTAASGWVRLSAVTHASGAIHVEVIDNGTGMTPAELAVALEPFGQMQYSQQNFGGAGMGVPIAKGFVEANRARFELTSEKGLGTIARVIFPPNRVLSPSDRAADDR